MQSARGCPVLPIPPALHDKSKERSRRIKILEEKLRGNETRHSLEGVEIATLSKELEDLRRELENEPNSQVQEHSKSPEKPDSSALSIKREIREIEKLIKQHKKNPALSGKQIGELDARLDALKSELTVVRGRKPAIMALAFQAAPHHSISVSLGGRISLHGLNAIDVGSLFSRFTHGNLSPGADVWQIWAHEDLCTAAVVGRDTISVYEELDHASSKQPHVICVSSSTLAIKGGVATALRNFVGALIVIEEETGKDEEEIACLLSTVGVSSRWSILHPCDGLEQCAVPRAPAGDVIGDLRLRDLQENTQLAATVAKASGLCLLEFDENLEEVLQGEEAVRLGILVDANPIGTGEVSDQAGAFLGFITYKFWGPPLKAMSISRVAVPEKYQMLGFGRQLVRWAINRAKQKPRYECDRVTLSATPNAIPFYARLNFSVVSDSSCEVPSDQARAKESAQKMEYSLGRSTKR